MPLDFSLLGQGPQFENALSAYKQGGVDRRQSNVRNALAAHKDDPTQAAPDLIANGELETGMALQDRGKANAKEATRKRVLGGYTADPAAARTEALSSGDTELYNQVAKMDDNQRAVAAQHAEDIASVGYALKQIPPSKRKGIIASPQMVQFLQDKGFKPDQIASFDPTDENLNAIISQGSSLKELIAQTKAEGDAAFERDKFGETIRHNKATEGVAATNAGANVTRANKVGSGRSTSSVPALPAGFVIEK